MLPQKPAHSALGRPQIARIGTAIGVLLVALSSAAVQAATPSIGGGSRIGAALGRDGIVRTMGDDSSGALGIGRSLNGGSPSRVALASGIIAIAAGDSHVIALKADHTVIAWGDNANGQLGDGTTTRRSTPVAVVGLANVQAISARGAHSLALTSDGRVWEWGGSPTPAQVAGITDVVEISAGAAFALARRRDGTVWAWGRNDDGQLGDGTRSDPFPRRATPAPVKGLANVVAISAGGDHALALLGDGSVRAWGANTHGALGDGTTVERLAPVAVNGLTGVTFIAASGATGDYGHSLAIRADGSVLAWGSNAYSELGDGTYDDHLTPIALTGLAGAISISTGFLHSFALIAGGTLAAWGTNENGQLGDPSIDRLSMPAAIAGLTGIADVRVGDLFTVALKTDGTVLAWGDNAFGQLGNEAFVFRSTPSVALSGVAKLAVGGAHMVALESDGSVVAWGDSRAAQVGDGTSVNRSAPAAVIGLGPGSGVTDISAGGLHTLALKSDGSVLSWGDNYSGEIGDRESDDASVPSRVLGLASVTAISAGGAHSVALRSDATVWTWGLDDFGQLGDGTRTATYVGRSTPRPVAGLNGVVKISAGASHTVVLKSDGTLWAWGRNVEGELGDGTRTDRLSPVRVASGLTDVVDISAGDAHTLALRRDGTVWAWGAGYAYQLGIGTADDHETPVQVVGLSHIVAISASGHSMALKEDGTVWSWGSNGAGELGDGTLVDRALPVVVLREDGAGSVAANDWFLHLEPSIAAAIPADKVPAFLLVAAAAGGDITASVRYRESDVGRAGNVYVFALVPRGLVKRAREAKDDDASPCVLAQVDASGELAQRSASTLQPYVSGVLSAQGQSVSLLNGAAAAQAAGATFFVGYGDDAEAMLANGTNRSAVSSAGGLQCPAALAASPGPLSGLWWNPDESGWGIDFTQRRNIVFAAWFTYDGSGNPAWYVASSCTMPSGSTGASGTCNGTLYRVSGPTFFGAAFDAGLVDVAAAGTLQVAFADASHATMTYSVGSQTRSVALQRQLFASGDAPPPIDFTDLWWNPAESGWGLAIAHQYGVMFLAWYVYDGSAAPVWYVVSNCAVSANGCSGTLYRTTGPAFGPIFDPSVVQRFEVGSASVAFSDANNATLTYTANGVTATKAITRQLF
jgi:alpha-tubulin suppressor-like RCC1 family protein